MGKKKFKTIYLEDLIAILMIYKVKNRFVNRIILKAEMECFSKTLLDASKTVAKAH